MVKLPELTGFLADALDIDPLMVERHSLGLQAAGRLASALISATTAADFLSACLCTDPLNATGAYHLPFAGGFTVDGNNAFHDDIGPGHASYEMLNLNFGEQLARVTEYRVDKSWPADSVASVSLSGRGQDLMALITFDGRAHGSAGNLWCMYGYRPLRALAAQMVNPSPVMTLRTERQGTSSISSRTCFPVLQYLNRQLHALGKNTW